MLNTLFSLGLLIQGVWSFCSNEELRCIDGTCVPISKKLDGRQDCPDGKYDEDFKNWCKASQMNCATGRCISRAKFQNGVNDCGDNSDEVQFPCKPPLYSCTGTSTVCIDKTNINDGTVDCPDATDEVKRLMGSCGLNNECDGNCTCGRFVPYSVCTNGTCVCDTGYKISGNRKQCLSRKLNDECSFDDDCSVVMKNSVCTGEVCGCGVGFIANGSNTCREVMIGDQCLGDQDCLMFNNNSRCSAGTCGCALGYYENNFTCLPRHIGDTCNITADCSSVIDDSSCDNGTCSCTTGYYAFGNMNFCFKRKLFDVCDVDADCVSVINNSVCQERLCACEENRKPDLNRTFCVQKDVGDECSLDNNCDLIDNSFCLNNLCTCTLGYHDYETNKTCLRRKIFDRCDVHGDCFMAVNSSLCQLGNCQCEKGMIEEKNNTSCRLRILGDTCSDDLDCAMSVLYSDCTNSSCACLLGYHAAKVNTCLLRKIGDESCQTDDDCDTAVSDSECRNNTCLCQSGYLELYNGTVCAKRNISSPCDHDVDCSDAMINSLCMNNSCECRSGYKAINDNTACELRALNDTCDVDTDCSDAISNSNCSSGRCFCNSGYQSSQRKSVSEIYTESPVNSTFSNVSSLLTNTTVHSENEMECVLRQIGNKCKVSTDCSDAVPNSLCKDNTCVCKQGFKTGANTSSICEANRINDVCSENADCDLAVNNSVCDRKECKCMAGFQVNEDKSECNRRKIFDKTCFTSSDCYMAVSYSNCIKRQCMCNSGYYPSNGNQTCTKFKIGDKNCVTILDCKEAVSKSSCRKGECRCINGYMAENNNTVCQKRIIGDPCDTDLDCSAAVFRSLCNGTCKCEDGYDANPITNLRTCVKSPQKLLDTCSFDEQCFRLDNISSCGNLHGFESRIKSCVCELGYFVRYDQVEQGHCYEPRLIGDYCENRAWCQFGDNVHCVDNECTCRPGHIPNATYNGCVHLPEAVGDFCRIDSHCDKIPHSECYVGEQNNTCQCHYKYKTNDDGRNCLPRSFVIEPPSPVVEIGLQCDARRTCNKHDEGRKYWRCAKEEGRQHTRCLCVPGYASKYNSETFSCKEIQTYYFNINITHELGCRDNKEDTPLCYQYQPIRILKQYNNENTKYFLYIRDRIVLQGFANLFNDTPPYIRDRYMTSEVLNITESQNQMKIGVLVYFLADYYNIINETELENEMINSLIRSHGEIGKSQLKMSWPFDDAIEYKDFDECTEQGGRFSDCSPIAWCLNTRVSYMCSCRHGYEDWSVDSDGRPGRICNLPQDVTTDSLSCSDGKCENQWEYISLALVGFGFVLFFFIGYEIYTRKKKLEKRYRILTFITNYKRRPKRQD
ncbi:low-density lipoprotein receptor-related protein 1B-like isoform X2 [Mercenaria mercenaria]|uniref:low-density lipoprotein receptor-related protein 1B-like isoform X2 n=1 Tax=Mercenaria mercenaria TaxID=6596 RepID=UPI00234F6683|nr:low-density lipoprotein receptor-related protein 1B-like isoform X2 [Mercenaria mercenaria]